MIRYNGVIVFKRKKGHKIHGGPPPPRLWSPFLSSSSSLQMHLALLIFISLDWAARGLLTCT